MDNNIRQVIKIPDTPLLKLLSLREIASLRGVCRMLKVAVGEINVVETRIDNKVIFKVSYHDKKMTIVTLKGACHQLRMIDPFVDPEDMVVVEAMRVTIYLNPMIIEVEDDSIRFNHILHDKKKIITLKRVGDVFVGERIIRDNRYQCDSEPAQLNIMLINGESIFCIKNGYNYGIITRTSCWCHNGLRVTTQLNVNDNMREAARRLNYPRVN